MDADEIKTDNKRENLLGTMLSCEYWLKRFKSGNFDAENNECEGRPEIFEEAEL